MNEVFSRIIFNVILGREPKDNALKSLAKLSKMMCISTLLKSEEYQSPGASTRRKNNFLSIEDYVLLAEAFEAKVEVPKSEVTFQFILDTLILPYFSDSMNGGKVQLIQSKSLPRSGHHFLVSLLTKYFGDELHYCESYQNPYCCNSRPCQSPFNKQMSNRFMLQKSHDFGLKDDMSTSGIYIVQHREPMARIQSNFELALKSQPERYVDNYESFYEFALAEAKSSVGFYNKWFQNDSLYKIYVDYDELVLQTEVTLRNIIEGIDPDNGIAEDRLLAALVGKENKVNTHNSPKTKRSVSEHRYYSEELSTLVYKIVKGGLSFETSMLPYLDH